MTKDELWTAFVRKNPSLVNSTVTFTAKGLRHFFNRTFEIALDEGEYDTIAGESQRPPHPSDSMPDFLKQFLHRKP
jgi:hypothetical protein